jgi:type IV pilus assembly protein PilV
VKRRARGYTVVELMMSLAVFATGVTGVIAMERATITSNQQARNLALANGIAQAWLSQLAADATLWTRTGDVTRTTWLTTITSANDLWQLPAYNATLQFGPQFDGFGAPVAANGVFCAQIRLTWLYGDKSAQQTSGLAGNGVIRTEVRVFWPRDPTYVVANACQNGTKATVDAVTAALGNGSALYHVVTQAGAVRQP